MNAIEFIESRTIEYLSKNIAQEAYNDFYEDSENEFCSFPYFRTKYNKKLKDNNLPTKRVQEVKREELESIPPVELSERVIKNYKDGDDIPDIPELIPTNTLFDEIISDRITKIDEESEEVILDEEIEKGGFTRQCVDIVAGDPGAGKTYSRCILAAKAKVYAREVLGKDIRVGFISGEMRESEWAKELNQCELLKEIEVDFMLGYVGYPNYEDIFWEAFGDYDIVVVDSLPAVISHFKMSWDITKGKMPTETQMIFNFIRKALKSVESNNNNVQLINQANKDGNYKGGTELPHMMSSMSFVKIDGQQRYMIFIKNRNNGKVKRKVYFNKLQNGDIEFNEEVYRATYEQVKDKTQSLGEFMGQLERDEINLDDMQDGDGIERSPEEMGTGGSTQEEEIQIDQNFNSTMEDREGNGIPIALPSTPRTDVVDSENNQVDLMDSIAEVESENQ